MFEFLIISSFCISNCFGMRPNRLGQSGPTKQTNTQRRVFRGPPPPPPVPHKKWDAIRYDYGHTETWVELGIDILSVTSGALVEKYIAQQLASKFTTKLTYKYGEKTAAEIIKRIAIGEFIGKLFTSNDLKKWKGIRIEIHWDFIRSVDCQCRVSQDHGVDHGIWPIKNISCNVFLV